MDWFRRRCRQLLGRCIGADDEPCRPRDDHELQHNNELSPVDITSVSSSENHHEDSCCTAIAVSEQYVTPDYARDYDISTVVIECTAAASDNNLLCYPVERTEVDTSSIAPMQCSDDKFYTLTSVASPSVFTGLVPVKQEQKSSHLAAHCYEPINRGYAVSLDKTMQNSFQEIEYPCEALTSVKTNDGAQHVVASTSNEVIHSLQGQAGEVAVSSLHDVCLSLSSLTNHGIKCPLSGVNIMSSTCDHNGGILTSGYGDLRITIPEGAIGVGDDVVICTAISLFGPYELSAHSQTDLTTARCSPYYWIRVSGSYNFHRPIQVEFEHFGACDPSHYQLLCCEDDDESYTMQPVDYELSFTVRGNISWCTFWTYHCCSYCLYHDCKDHIGLNKIIALYLKPADLGQRDNFIVQIWFSFPISHCLRRNQELYTSKDMVLDDDCSCTFLTPSDKTCKNYFELSYHQSVGWYICYLRSTTIQTEEINFNHYTNIDNLRANEDISQFPPRFILDVTKNCECKNNLNMEIKVTLFKFGEMISKETVPFKLFVPVLSLIKYFTTNTSGRKHSMPSHECKVCTPELKDLVNYSKKISFYWKEIAVLLGIQDKIDVIDMDNYHAENKCFSMFDTWLKRTVNACWCRFIEALYGVGLNRVAEEAKTHIRSSKTATVPCLDIDAEEFLPVIQPVSLESKSEELKQPLQSISLGSYCLSAIQPISFESINEELTQAVSLKSLECESLSLSVQTTELQLQMKPLSISEGNLKIAHDTLNLRNLIRYLKDIPDTDLDYFIYRLLPNDSAVNVIKDIKLNSGRLSKEDDVKKVCEAFLKIKSSSWTEVHRALVQADCYDLARIIEATFLTN